MLVNNFVGKDILSVNQFTKRDLEYVIQTASNMRIARPSPFFKGKILTCLFYEPSTRTSSSFIAAMEKLGGSVIAINGVEYSSVAKGENLPDTVRTLEAYSDVIVLRHPEQGAAAEAAKWARKPVINAGDGVGEHPTQALLDLYTIQDELGRLDGLTVTLLGDLKNGRTVHSLSKLLMNYDVKLQLVSPPSLAMPDSILDELRKSGNEIEVLSSTADYISNSDVLYATRVQKERFQDLEEYENLRKAFCITPETMRYAKEKMILMHPFPRVGEISMEVDQDPRAAYFRQIQNGLHVRMALLAMVLGDVL